MNLRKRTVVPNNQPYRLVGWHDDNEATQTPPGLIFEPLVAWMVDSEWPRNDEPSGVGTPVGTDALSTSGRYAIYDLETTGWVIPEERHGKGEESLLEAFLELQQETDRLNELKRKRAQKEASPVKPDDSKKHG